MQRNKWKSSLPLLTLLATIFLWGCGKSEVNQASPSLTPAETARNEPPPRGDDGKPKELVKPAMDGPGEIVGRDRSGAK